MNPGFINQGSGSNSIDQHYSRYQKEKEINIGMCSANKHDGCRGPGTMDIFREYRYKV